MAFSRFPRAWLERAGQDLRFGARQLVKAPGFTVVSIVTIALGIGACTAIFSVANKMVIHPLDYDEPEQIVMVWESSAKFAKMVTSPGNLHAWRTQTTAFADVAGMYGGSARLAEGERDLTLNSYFISPDFFRVARLRPELGREFTADEFTAGKDRVVLLSRGLWKTRFAGRTDVVGEVVRLDDKPCTVVGVINDPLRSGNYVMLPGPLTTQTENFTNRGLFVWARLKPGATIRQALAELEVVAARVAAEHPATYRGRGVTAMRYVDFATNALSTQIWLLVGAVGLLLLIACVNVANLLLARASARQREIAIRLALGARRSRIVSQLLGESLLLTLIGGALGIALAWALIGPLASASTLPRADRIAVDGWVLMGSCGLILLTSVGIGLVPALQATQGNLIEPLKDGGQNASGGRRRLRTRNLLVALQVASAFVLLVGTGLLARSLRALQQADQGMKTDAVMALRVGLDSRRPYNTPAKVAGLTRPALERIRALPGVMAASFSSGLPSSHVPADGFILEGQSRPASPLDPITMTDIFPVTPGYLQALGIPLVAGRELTERDGTSAAPVVLVNQEMARKYFPGQNPVGRQILLLSDASKTWNEIVGVVGDVRSDGPYREPSPQLYRTLESDSPRALYLVLKVAEFSPALAAAVRETLTALDPALSPGELEPYEQLLARRWGRQKFNLTLIGMFSGFALVLAALGIYGVTAYSVSHRTREIGIRMALGALPADVLRLVLGHGLRIVGLGLLLGTGGALAATRLLNALLYGTSAQDPLTFAFVIATLLLVALGACLLPARRATKVQPLVALRHE